MRVVLLTAVNLVEGSFDGVFKTDKASALGEGLLTDTDDRDAAGGVSLLEGRLGQLRSLIRGFWEGMSMSPQS